MKPLFHPRRAIPRAFYQGHRALLPLLGFASGAWVFPPVSALAQAPSGLPPLTVPGKAPVAPVLISELRASGPRGKQDAFIELFNTTAAPLSLSGWSLRGRDAQGAPVVFVLAPGVQIGARGHLLLVGRDYSLPNLATGDRLLAPGFGFSRGVRLLDAKGKLIDAIGPTGADAAFREGAGVPAFAFAPVAAPPAQPGTARPPISQFSLVRQAIDGQPQDTGDNARDFVLLSVSGTLGAQKTRIGTPGPENAASPALRPALTASPEGAVREGAVREGAATEGASTEISTDAPQAQRIALQTDPALNSMRRARRELGPLKTFGTMTLRYRLVNDSPNPLKTLSFRVNSITSDPNSETAPVGSADVRLIRGLALPHGATQPAETSASDATEAGVSAEVGSFTESGGAVAPPRRTVSVWRARLSPAPSQPLGGALNALLNVELPPGGIAPGAVGEIWFSFGVERTGNYRVVLGNQTRNIVFEGHTEDDLQNADGQPSVETGGRNGGSIGGRITSGGANGAQPTPGNPTGAGGNDPTPATGPETEAGEGIILEGNTEDGVPAPPVDPSTKDS